MLGAAWGHEAESTGAQANNAPRNKKNKSYRAQRGGASQTSLRCCFDCYPEGKVNPGCEGRHFIAEGEPSFDGGSGAVGR